MMTVEDLERLVEADARRLDAFARVTEHHGTELGIAATKAAAVHVGDVAELAGLTEDAIAAAEEAARQRGSAGYLIELVLP